MGSMSILLGCIDSRPNLVQAAISDVNELGDHDLFWFVHICKPFMDM